jgi:chloramphenicol O-acetyltransferase type A
MQDFKQIDIEHWHRKESYLLFKDYEDPFWGVTVQLDITSLWKAAKVTDTGVHYLILYALSKAVNTFDPMRYRRRGDHVVCLNQCDVGCTVLKENQAFTFAYYPDIQGENIIEYLKRARKIAAQAKAETGLHPRHDEDALIYATTVPWISFTQFKHPRKSGTHSIPRVVIGGAHNVGALVKLPFSIEVDHALMDGVDVSKFLELFELALEDAARDLF